MQRTSGKHREREDENEHNDGAYEQNKRPLQNLHRPVRVISAAAPDNIVMCLNKQTTAGLKS